MPATDWHLIEGVMTCAFKALNTKLVSRSYPLVGVIVLCSWHRLE